MPETTLWFNLEVNAQRYPNKTAYRFFGRELSYGELHRQAQALAGWLQARGVQRGDRVLIYLQSCPQFVVAFYAAQRAAARLAVGRSAAAGHVDGVGDDNAGMSDESQIVVPPSFIALFIAPGRSRPSAPRDEIAACHEHCEDLANLLTEHASTKLWELGVTEADVLERIHRGLLAGDTALPPAQAQWVICRLAELLAWPMPVSAPASPAP